MISRQGSRVAIERPGRVETASGARLPCIVHDISAEGARVLMAQAADVPDTLVLYLDTTGDRWACRVVWRQLGEIGVAFV